MGKKGQALTEFILVLPVILIILMAVFNVGYIYLEKYNLEKELETVSTLYENNETKSLMAYTSKEDITFDENIIIPDIEEEVIETEELPKLEAVTIEEKNESDIVEPLEEQVESDITEVKEESIEFNNDILINEIKKAVSHKKPIPSPFIEGSIIPKVNEEKQKEVVSGVKKQESIKEVIPKEENKLDVISKPEVKSISRSDVAKIAQKVNSIEINSSKFINENTRKQMEEELLLYKEQLLKYKEEQLKKQENLRKQMEEFSSIFNITKDDLKY